MRVLVLSAVCFFGAVIAVPLSAQAGSFHAPKIVGSGDRAPFQRLFDADGDGDMDAVGTRLRVDTSLQELQVQVFRNNGGEFGGGYSASFSGIRPTSGIARAATGDLDGDGDQDVVVAGGTTLFYKLLNDGVDAFGDTRFTPSAIAIQTPVTIEDVAIADVDGDARADLVVLARGPSSGSAYLEVRTANGTFTTTNLRPPQSSSRLLLLDVDGDAALEIGVARQQTVEVLHVGATGITTGASLTDATITSPTGAHWTSGDIDNDGDTDLVAFELASFVSSSARVHILRRTGIATFAVEPPYAGGPSEYLADVDGDGDLDGVCCGGGQPSYPWRQFDFNSTFEIAHNQGGGVFAPAIRFAGMGSESLAGVADLDGDGDVELVAGICVFYGEGPWLEQPVRSDGGAASMRNVQLAIDQDGDGDPDVAGRVQGGAINDGSGAYSPAAPLAPPPGLLVGNGGFVGDFDGDGDPDEIWPLFSASSPSTFVEMGRWRNNGSGALTYVGRPTPPGMRMGLGSSPDQTSVADVDGDGDLDAIGTSDPRYEGHHSEFFWNDGSGNFTAGPTMTGECFAGTADFDGDGRVDLLTSLATNELRVRLGTGDPLLPIGPALAAFPGTLTLWPRRTSCIVDADGDGRVDLLVWDITSGVDLLKNTTANVGAPQFTYETRLGVMNLYGQLWPQIEAFDVDGDGLKDLVMGPMSSILLGPGRNMISFYRRLPNAGSSPARPYDFGISYVAAPGFGRDVDGDGDLDLAGPQIVLNKTRHGAAAGYRRQYGAATPGEAGVAPLLGAEGPFVAGGIKRLHLRGVTGPTTAVLAISLLPANLPSFPLPGITCLVDPSPLLMGTWPISAPGAGAAEATASLDIWLPPFIAGMDFYDQVLVFDPAGPSGAAASNGLHVRIGF